MAKKGLISNNGWQSSKEKENSKNHMVIKGSNTGITPLAYMQTAKAVAYVGKDSKKYDKRGTKNSNSRKAARVALRKECY